MATLNLGKLKPTWKGAYSGATAYTVDDMVSYQGSSYINIQDSTGIDPLDNSYWELIADGANVLTTQGDLTTHDGVVTTRLAIGQEGEVLTAASGDATWAAANGYVGYKALDSNMEPVWGDPNAVNDYGADGKYPWLADYANNWIPQHPIPLGSGNCGPVMRTHKNYGPYRRIFWLNENHELVCRGKDDYFWSGRNGGERHNTGIGVAISAEFGGLKAGEYFVRTWGEQQTFFALTNLGNVFSAGENSEGELGLGDTTHRYMWNKIPYLGPDATLSGLDCKIACLSLSTEGNGQYSGEIGVFAIDVHGRLWAWGDNTSGKLGIGHANNTTVPTHVTALTDVVMVSSAYHTTYFVTKENGGRLYTCGGSPHGVRAGLADSTTPVADATMTGNVWQIILNDHAHYTTAWTTRYSNGFVLKDNGELWTIGANQYGMRGNGNTTESAAWERTGGSLTFAYVKLVGISAYGGAGAIGGTPNSPNGKIYHWGYNGYGACGTGNTS
ncbi:MAG: RCC1 domain-containing protein, partial [Bacteriovoracaceae bacterium]